MTEKSSSGAKPRKPRNAKAALLPELDLLGMVIQKRRSAVCRQEAAALIEVMKALKAHPAVAWCERQNSGAARIGNRFVRFGWLGCPDILGMLRDGRFLGVEVKAKNGHLRPEQTIFLERIRSAGGVAFVAHDLRDVRRELTTGYQHD
jgi:hypothetical protein